jgi:hypothetical protein
VTTLTRSQVTKWRDEAGAFLAEQGETTIPACAVLDSCNDVHALCDALLDAWADYHARPAPEPANTPEGP